MIVNNFLPDRAGGGAIFGDLCYGLAQRGFAVTVRCGYPYYPEWRDKSGQNGLQIRRQDMNGVRVERHGLYIPRHPTRTLPRLCHEISFFLSLMRTAFFSWRFDIVMVICPAMSSVAVAAVIKLLFRKPLWLNVQDLAAEAAFGVGLLGSGRIGRVVLSVQRWLFNRADVWSTISPVMQASLAPQRRRGQPLYLLPNWMDAVLEAEIARERARNPTHQLHRPVRLFYGGNLGLKQDLIHLLMVLHASQVEFDFLIAGDGAQGSAIRAWLAKVGDARFRIVPFQDAAEFARALVEADYYVITEARNAGSSFMPSKLVPGLAAGTPVLCVADADSPLGVEVRTSEPGPWFSCGEVHDVPEFLQAAAMDPGLHRRWSDNAIRRAMDFQRDAIVDRFATLLNEHGVDTAGKKK